MGKLMSTTSWPTTSPPSLHARRRTTTISSLPFNLPSPKESQTLTTSLPLLLALQSQQPELPTQDARRLCQMVPSDQLEVKEPAMKDSAAVPPEFQTVMS